MHCRVEHTLALQSLTIYHFSFQLSFPPVSFSGVSVPTLGTWTPPDTNTGASQSLIEKCTIKTKFIKVSYSGLVKCFSRLIDYDNYDEISNVRFFRECRLKLKKKSRKGEGVMCSTL